jgi:hypothetical protein
MIDVHNLGGDEILTMDTDCPREAVRMAWQYANGKGADVAPKVTVGKRSVACGDWCALYR